MDDAALLIAELLTRRWPALARKRDPRDSAYALLARRGFPGSVIWPAIQEVAEAQEETDLSQFADPDDT